MSAVQSITLSYNQVACILEEHINAHILRTPHHVNAVDPWDWDASNEHQFSISLAPMASQSAAPAAEQLVQAVLEPAEATAIDIRPIPHLPLRIGTNGNGHAVTVVTPPQEATQAPPAERPKSGKGHRITEAQRSRILELSERKDWTVIEIASAVGCSKATIFDVRKAARQHQSNPQETAGDV